MAGKNSALFDSQAAQYAQYRPDYPAELYRRIYGYADSLGAASLALDVATGSGQAAVELAKVFSKVTAIDSSEQQLREAKSAERVEYRKGTAEDTGAPAGEVDLITVAQALHWFDLPKFWTEAHRVLRPGGVLAAWGYGLPVCPGNPEATRHVVKWGYGEAALGPYWSPLRRLIDEEYASVEPDAALFCDVARHKLDSTRECTLDFFVGYLSSWSAYATYKQRHPERDDPLHDIRRDLMASYKTVDGSHVMTVGWPMFLLLTRKH